MVDFVLSLSTWTGCFVTMAFSAVAGFAVYLVFYKLILKYKRESMRDPTSNIFRVVGMLVSLMLALAFSEVIGEMRTIRSSIQREAVAISDIFDVLKLFDTEGTRGIRIVLVDYAQAVIDYDWPALADDRLSPRVGALKNQLAKAVINLKPATTTQEKMISHILDDIDALSDYRVIRLDSALVHPPIYVPVIIFGFLVAMACFGVYRPHLPLVALVTLYTVFVGLVLYLVLAMSDPFQGDIGVAPTSFGYLVEKLQSEI